MRQDERATRRVTSPPSPMADSVIYSSPFMPLINTYSHLVSFAIDAAAFLKSRAFLTRCAGAVSFLADSVNTAL